MFEITHKIYAHFYSRLPEKYCQTWREKNKKIRNKKIDADWYRESSQKKSAIHLEHQLSIYNWRTFKRGVEAGCATF